MNVKLLGNSAVVFFKGMLIGIANIIPGVSGGTFALLLGIYERLIRAINSVGPKTLGCVLRLLTCRSGSRKDFANEWRRVDGTFLSMLGGGALVAIGASSKLISYLLEVHPSPTLAFFVGLILPSICVPYKMMKRRGGIEVVFAILGVGLVVGIGLLGRRGTVEGNYMVMCLCGALAISAMILPGVSGSFLLLVLGQYKNVVGSISAITNWAGKTLTGRNGGEVPWHEAGLLAFFAIGAVVGLAGFSRLLAILLKKWHSQTMAFLIGLIAGSLWTLWPFKVFVEGRKLQECANDWPAEFNSEVVWVCIALIAGFAAAVCVMKVGKTEDGIVEKS